ncbi:hypothetical protein [Azospirillum rugosum]|uniref:Uncharacterized protein n=1 Tax=Azospirillum rugosum TaxID=416170 RepID=A0ABS4SRP3_9PROT|nr:hypothetical protein [Azospirillum rugosum]MBP2295236.1 hypothetical protein [Azospirillum rugosum]MDQ0528610.1 hypothetical protein [Azospirillum rugosum]
MVFTAILNPKGCHSMLHAAKLTVLAPILVLWALPAAGKDPDLPPLDPPNRWHRMGPTDAESSSRCIGQLVSPICTLETLLACFEHSINALCTLATGRQIRAIQMDGRGKGTTLYRVVATRRLKARDVPRRCLNDDLEPTCKAGDVQITLSERSCWSNGCPPPDKDPIRMGTTYTLRKKDGGRWIVFEWYSPPY